MEEQYPLWLLLHLFLDLSAENVKKRRAILGLFRILPRALPPDGGFSKFIFVAENHQFSCPSSCSYWSPLQKLSTIAFRCNFVGSFFTYTYLSSSSNRTTKNLPVWTRCLSSFIFRNGRSTMSEQIPWWHRSKKPRDIFLCYLHINTKNCARRRSVLQDMYVLPEKNEIFTQLYDMKEHIKCTMRLNLHTENEVNT